jgi:drug/metabolite transporter (DMT)-like permease
MRLQNRLSALALGVYVLLAGINSTALKWLQARGEASLAYGAKDNPISFCNVFFFSSLVVGLALLLADLPRLRSQLQALRPVDVGWLALHSSLGTFLGPVAYFIALSRLSVVTQTFLFALTLPISALLAHRLLGERLPRAFFPGVGLIALALLLYASRSTQSPAMMSTLSGVLWALVAISAFAANALTSRILAPRGWCAGLTLGLGSLGSAFVFGLIALYLYGPDHFLYLKIWWVVGVIGVYACTISLGTSVSLRLAYRHLPVRTVGLWGTTGIVVAVVSAALILHEPINLVVLISMGGLLGGVLVAQQSS